MGDGGWWATFWFFKSLDNNMVYSSGIDIYVYIWESVQNNFVMCLIFFRSWRPYPTKTKIPICRTIFVFSSKTSFFAVLGALFGTILFNFVSFFFLIAPRGLYTNSQGSRRVAVFLFVDGGPLLCSLNLMIIIRYIV